MARDEQMIARADQREKEEQRVDRAEQTFRAALFEDGRLRSGQRTGQALGGEARGFGIGFHRQRCGRPDGAQRQALIRGGRLPRSGDARESAGRNACADDRRRAVRGRRIAEQPALVFRRS
ncbi:hypothetical protein FHS96_005179 [Sphingomonas zeicaulis]